MFHCFGIKIPHSTSLLEAAWAMSFENSGTLDVVQNIQNSCQNRVWSKPCSEKVLLSPGFMCGYNESLVRYSGRHTAPLLSIMSLTCVMQVVINRIVLLVSADNFVFWSHEIMTPCTLTDSNQFFWGTYCLHLQGITSIQKLKAAHSSKKVCRHLLLYTVW